MLPDVPFGLKPKGLWNFLSQVKKTIDVWTGGTTGQAITKQDLIDYNLINSDGDRLDDSGSPIT